MGTFAMDWEWGDDGVILSCIQEVVGGVHRWVKKNMEICSLGCKVEFPEDRSPELYLKHWQSGS